MAGFARLFSFMEKFIQRLKYYGIGFGIGMIFVFFFFRNRGCSWFPENRVKNSLLSKILVVHDDEMKIMKKHGFTSKSLYIAINKGEVDFGKSAKHQTTKVYAVTIEDAHKKQVNCFLTLNEDSFISEVRFNAKKASSVKPSKNGFGNFIHFPVDKDLIFIDSSINKTCHFSALRVRNENHLLKEMMSHGKLDFKKSQLTNLTKPEHCISIRFSKDISADFYAIWFQEKIEIERITSKSTEKCLD